MRKYYYLNARNEQEGPIPGELLLRYGVNGHTKVWTNGMKQWQSAMSVKELSPLFSSLNESVPPPPPFSMEANTKKPDNLLIWSI